MLSRCTKVLPRIGRIATVSAKKQSLALRAVQNFSHVNFSTGSDNTSKSQPAEGESTSSTSSRTEVAKFDYDEYDDYEPRTAGEAVSFWTVVFLRLGLLAAGIFCVGVLATELFPGRLGPYSLFSEAFDIVKVNDEIRAICGESMKAYGRDAGRNTEGRRNHIDHRGYKGDDGSNRMRIRFYVQGSRGRVLVWAEVSNKMADNEYVYLICQDMRTGRVVTIEDNRARLDSEAMMKGPDNEIMSKISSIFNTKK